MGYNRRACTQCFEALASELDQQALELNAKSSARRVSNLRGAILPSRSVNYVRFKRPSRMPRN